MDKKILKEFEEVKKEYNNIFKIYEDSLNSTWEHYNKTVERKNKLVQLLNTVKGANRPSEVSKLERDILVLDGILSELHSDIVYFTELSNKGSAVDGDKINSVIEKVFLLKTKCININAEYMEKKKEIINKYTEMQNNEIKELDKEYEEDFKVYFQVNILSPEFYFKRFK